MKKILIVIILMIISLLSASLYACALSKAIPSDGGNVASDATPYAPPSSSDDEESETEPTSISFLPTIDLSDKTYIAFGDSITWGYANLTRMEKPYPALVSELLGLASYVNSSVSGATLTSNPFGLFNETANILSVTSHYDIISVMMGVNDYNRSLPIGTPSDTDNNTFYGSLYMVMEHFRTYYPDSFVFFMTPFNVFLGGHDGYENNSQGYNLADISNAIKTMAEKYGFPVLDLFTNGLFELEMTSPASDGIHPSQEFFRNYTAPQIAQFITDHFDDIK